VESFGVPWSCCTRREVCAIWLMRRASPDLRLGRMAGGVPSSPLRTPPPGPPRHAEDVPFDGRVHPKRRVAYQCKVGRACLLSMATSALPIRVAPDRPNSSGTAFVSTFVQGLFADKISCPLAERPVARHSSPS
jgi:hypothetical protein